MYISKYPFLIHSFTHSQKEEAARLPVRGKIYAMEAFKKERKGEIKKISFTSPRNPPQHRIISRC